MLFCLALLQVTRADVARMLRADALNLSLGVLLVAAGLTAALLYARFRRTEHAVAWLGLFALLYGVRLLARTDTVPVIFELPGSFWRRLAAAITYVIPVPGMLVLRETFPAWRRPFGWAAMAIAAFGVVAVVSDTVLRRAYSAQTPNNLIAIALLTAGLVLLFRWAPAASRDLPALRLGMAALVGSAIVDNLRGLGALAWPRRDLEPVGFAVLIACLARITARRLLEGAQRLSALDKELSIAREIQASILPRTTPSTAGLRVAARYEPMSAVAGDFYELLDVGPGRLGVLVADVSGHGVPAALIASMVKVAMAAQRPRAGDPASVLAGISAALDGQLGRQYVTAAYLFLDRQAEVFRYAAAGHPCLVRWRAGEACEIEQNGFPIGLMGVARYDACEEPLLAGDRFLLYTDGLVDAANRLDEPFTLGRLKAALADAADLAAAGAADLILGRSRQWADGSASDDVTLVLVDCA